MYLGFLFIAGVFSLLGFPHVLHGAAPDELIEKAKKSQLASDPQWLRLGHYHSSLCGGYVSQVVSDSFFLAEGGRRNPEKELFATIQGLFDLNEHEYQLAFGNQKEKQFIRCQFPARTLWLMKKLELKPMDLPPLPCNEFDTFVKNLSAESVSVVFSSYFINNPSSTFGHSLLRINKHAQSDPNKEKYELLDHGINFAASVTTENSLVYAVLGLTGGFKGTFSNVPYYYKVREYNDFQSRDLWSYELDLSRDEIELLIAHLWELGPTWFNYYYFTQNCSYQILTALEAAAPRFTITDFLPSLYVIPGDTIKQVVRTPGLVKGISYRPSIRSEFQKRLSELTPDETQILKEVAVEKKIEALDLSVQDGSKAKILDAAIDYMDLKYPSDLLHFNSVSAQWKQRLLLSRSKIPVRTLDLKIEPDLNDAPHEGHDSFRLGAEEGIERNFGSYSQLKFRFALHDALDPPTGYPKNSQVEFMNLSFRYLWDKKVFNLEEAILFQVMSLNPISAFNKDFSFRVSVGARRLRDSNSRHSLGGGIEGGGGYAFEPFSSVPLVFFALAEAETTFSPSFLGSALRVGAGPYGGLLIGRGSLKWMIEGRYRYELFSYYPHVYQFNSEIRHNFKNTWALSLRNTLFTTSYETALTAFIYY